MINEIHSNFLTSEAQPPHHKDQLLIFDPWDIVFLMASSSISLLIARMAANIKPKKAPMKSPIANAIITSSFLVCCPGIGISISGNPV